MNYFDKVNEVSLVSNQNVCKSYENIVNLSLCLHSTIHIPLQDLQKISEINGQLEAMVSMNQRQKKNLIHLHSLQLSSHFKLLSISPPNMFNYFKMPGEDDHWTTILFLPLKIN